MSNSDRLEELAQRLAARTRELRGEMRTHPQLRLVAESRNRAVLQPDQILADGTRGMDAIVRESHCRMIRHYRRRCGWQVQEIIDQACFGYTGIEAMPDDCLVQLHKDLERAQECIRDDVSFEDAGLLRSRFG
ncbi:hypothetical protein [Xanthomonas melonis]|uniref:hypothetical protein n=1 Tax=Xanthomonas melonis TaxID=56456 RepID=UPI001E56734D|nr:hypothetical protein [Xanthomonas melonis]